MLDSLCECVSDRSACETICGKCRSTRPGWYGKKSWIYAIIIMREARKYVLIEVRFQFDSQSSKIWKVLVKEIDLVKWQGGWLGWVAAGVEGAGWFIHAISFFRRMEPMFASNSMHTYRVSKTEGWAEKRFNFVKKKTKHGNYFYPSIFVCIWPLCIVLRLNREHWFVMWLNVREFHANIWCECVMKRCG